MTTTDTARPYVLNRSYGHDPSEVLLGPPLSHEQLRDLQARFARERDGCADIHAFDECFDLFVEWLVATQGFRRVPWDLWTI